MLNLVNDQYSLNQAVEILESTEKNQKLRQQIIEYVIKKRYLTSKNQLKIIIPQYHSNYCINDCKYCAFKKSNSLVYRRRLSDEDYKKEIKTILDWGYRVIEFVFASDPIFNAERVAKRILYTKEYAKKINIPIMIGINSDFYKSSDFMILNHSGVDFIIQWMETYDIKAYGLLHPKNTKKSNFSKRYNAYENAIKAGIKKYGIGVLFGLSNWLEDIIRMLEHIYEIKDKYDINPYIIGIPRIKKALNNSSSILKNPVSDEIYIFICYYLKLIFPEIMLFVNTREKLSLNKNIIKGGGDLFTIDCGTYPSAYLQFNNESYNKTEQFATYNYNRKVTTEILKDEGYRISYYW